MAIETQGSGAKWITLSDPDQGRPDTLRPPEPAELPLSAGLGLMAGLVVLFVMFGGVSVLRKGRCRWKRDPAQSALDKLPRWVCRECGADAYAKPGTRPATCKRALRSATQ